MSVVALMKFESPLIQGVLLKRYKRFLAEIVVNNQEHRVIHCPNMGAMIGCDALGSRIWFSRSNSPHRKYPETWELVEVDAGYLVCINPQKTNRLIFDGVEQGIIKELQGYTQISFDTPLIGEHCPDLYLEGKDKCVIGIKNVTLGDEIHRGFFPDSLTPYGVQQLKTLIQSKDQGYRTVLIYCAMHTGIDRIFPADHIDSEYGKLLRQAIMVGVEILGYRVDITLNDIYIATPVEVCIPARMICASRP